MNVTWNKSNERLVYDRIRVRLKGVDSCHMIRIENVAEQGTPDMNIRWGDHEIWVELKYSKRLDEVVLRPAQFAWHFKRGQACPGSVVLVAGNEEHYVIARAPYITSISNEQGVRVSLAGLEQIPWRNLDGFVLLETLFSLR